MLTDEHNKKKDAADQSDYQTDLSRRYTSCTTIRLQYMPQFTQHMQTAVHDFVEVFPTYNNHQHDAGNTGSNDDRQHFSIWREYRNFRDLQKTILISYFKFAQKYDRNKSFQIQ